LAGDEAADREDAVERVDVVAVVDRPLDLVVAVEAPRADRALDPLAPEVARRGDRLMERKTIQSPMPR